MDALDKWYAFFENSEEVRNLVQWLFEYLPEEMRAQVPHLAPGGQSVRRL